MSDLAEFLRARLAEDETAAREAIERAKEMIAALDPDEGEVIEAAWIDHPDRWEQNSCTIRPSHGNSPVTLTDAMDPEGPLQHAVRWDPARVLAEVAAKRARLSLIADLANSNDPTMAAVGRQLMRGEAQPYAEHPEADPDWRLDA